MLINPEIKQRILDAANMLAAEGGDNPTNDAIREHLGGGSLSHISPVMREWRASKKEQVSAALEIPADLKKIIETSLSQVWGSASQLASVAIDNVRQDAEKDIDAATQERDEALSEITRLEELVASLEKQGAENEKIIQAARKTVETERAENARIAAESSSLSVRIEERDAQMKELKATLKEATTGNKELQAELVQIAKSTASKSKR